MYNIIMEKDLCKKCGECCRKIAVDFERKIIYKDGVETLSEEFASMLEPVEKRENVTFCKCKFLEDNICTNSDKPEECINYPSSPFAFLPEECGYYGEIFLKNENIKQKIRKLKEEIIHYEAEIITNKSEQNQLRKIIEKHQAFIDKYKIYGSENW